MPACKCKKKVDAIRSLRIHNFDRTEMRVLPRGGGRLRMETGHSYHRRQGGAKISNYGHAVWRAVAHGRDATRRGTFLRNQWELICHLGVLRLRARRAIWEGKVMPKGTGWLSLVGFFGLVSAAGAQAPSPPTASTQFEGTYALVSSTGGSRSGGRPGPCPEFRPGPLTIAQGRVQ